MQLNLIDKINFFSGNKEGFESVQAIKSLPVFSDEAVGYLDGLSKRLLKLPEAKGFPDIITFAFWCRRANVLSMKKAYEDEVGRLGRGVAFHIAPSNVPINFAYSLAAGLLAGNVNVVRLSSKEFEQIDIVCNVITDMNNQGDFKRVADMVYLVKYSHSKEVTDFLSSLCNTRIIWGGDSTIAEIRKSPLPSRSTEVMFSDRYSLCMINSEKYLSDYDHKKTARDFYNDTYLTDQNACTSPKLIVWTNGKNGESEKAKSVFWGRLTEIINSEYSIKAVQAINKLTAFYKTAAVLEDRGMKLSKPSENHPSNNLMRIQLKTLDEKIVDCFDNSGYFYEYSTDDINEIKGICGVKCQTISYIGFTKEELNGFVSNDYASGIDRIVPVGKTLDFSLVWDGYDLIYSLSRKITII